jgi:hypothetical protein
MAIKSEWIVASTTARNALAVTDGDVAVGAEAKVLADGYVYRAVRSGSGSTCWSAVAPESSGSFVPTAAAVTNVTSADGSDGHYLEQGGIVTGSAVVTVVPTSAAACEFTIDAPVGTVDTAYGVVAGAGSITAGYAVASGTKISVAGTAASTDPALVLVFFTYKKA